MSHELRIVMACIVGLIAGQLVGQGLVYGNLVVGLIGILLFLGYFAWRWWNGIWKW